MNASQAWDYVTRHESNGNLKAVGDNGRAAGLGQMWWAFRLDYWPSWAWNLLAVMDEIAFMNCLHKHSPITSLRQFYETVYNPGADAPDMPAEPVDF